MAYLGRSPSQGVRNRYYKTASGGETSISGALTGGTLTFTDGNYVDVNLNGLTLVAGTDYNTSTANTISGLSALTANDVVEIVVYDVFSVFSGNVDSNFSVGGNLSVTGTTALTGNATAAGTLGVTGVVTANAGVVVDNITIDGTEIDLSSGNLTIDVAGQIILDADTQGSGNGILLKDAGTLYGSFFRSSSNLHIKSEASDQDMLFMGNDGGSEITALTLDMSAAGAAAFNAGATFADSCTITTADNTAQLTLKSTDADASVGPVLELVRDSGSPADSDLLGSINFIGNDDGGNETTFASISTQIGDASNGTESCGLQIKAMSGGSLVSRADFLVSETVFNNGSIDMDFRVESNGDTHMLFVDAANDFVGIGESSPNVLLHVTGPSAQIAIDTTSGGEPLLRFRENGSTRALLKMDGTNNMQFHTGPDGNVAEVGRFDPSGNFLVGKTASGSFDQSSVELNNTGYIMSARDDGGNLFLSRQGSTNPEGAMIALYKVNTEIGRIGVKSARMYMGSSSTGLAFEGSQADSIYPVSATADGLLRDNYIDLGFSSSRFDDIYATNGTIQTSDENEKQDISSLTSAEITAAKAISALFKTFKWKDKVTAKGDAARTHTGVVAQEIQKAMSDAGLDVAKYAFWCSNTWWEVEETTTDDDGEKHTGTVSYQTEKDAPEGATKRTRLGVRYPELLAFIGAATEQRLVDIETRLAALESKVS